VAWVERGETFALMQKENPGPQELLPLGQSEARTRERVQALCGIQADIARANALADAGERAEALRPFVGSDLYYARVDALEGLGDCGKAALPVLRRLLGDANLSRRHGDVVRAMAKAGGAAAGPDLTAILERETAFWKQKAPNLPQGWWNGGGQANKVAWDEVERLRERYGVTLEAVRGLQAAKFAGGRKPVADLRDFWRSLPQLEDRSGLNQMSEECDRCLAALKE
jgi:hypothetical protein